MVFRNTSSTGFLRGEGKSTMPALNTCDRSRLAADDPARELDVFVEIVVAFAGNSHCKGAAVRGGPCTRRRTLLTSASRRPAASSSASTEAG